MAYALSEGIGTTAKDISFLRNNARAKIDKKNYAALSNARGQVPFRLLATAFCSVHTYNLVTESRQAAGALLLARVQHLRFNICVSAWQSSVLLLALWESVIRCDLAVMSWC